MQHHNTQSEIFDSIREQIMALPPERRRELSEKLIAFLLIDRKANATASGKLSQNGPGGITREQLALIRSLGAHTRDLNDLMGEDPYFFM